MVTREGKQQYLDLRRKLSDYNYTESFNAESTELVNHLLSDLISTTNSYKVLQEKEVRIANDLSLSQAQLFPLRKENSRLARENHDLHNDTIRLNDEIRNGTEDYTRELQRMQEHLQDSRFLCESLQEQLRQNQESMDKLRSAYDAVTDPSLKSHGSGNVNANRAIKMTNKISKQSAADLDVLRAASIAPTQSGAVMERDNIIKTLRSQLDAANKAFAGKDEECKRLISAVAAREQEITRSSKLISASAKATGGAGSASMDTGTGSGAFLLSGTRVDQYIASDISNKRLIDQLNGQVDFLNNELAKREAQLVEVNDKLLQFEALRAELNHRNQLLDQARKESGQASMRIRALEQKVIEYQNAETEFAVAAEEMGAASVSGAPGSPSGETKHDHATREMIELKVLLGRVSSERDDLREETARLRRITSTLTAPAGTTTVGSNGNGAGVGVGAAVRGKVGAASTVLPGKRGTASAVSKSVPSPAASAVSAVSVAGARAGGEKERQQAATNILVIELNAEIESLRKKVQVLTRSLAQKEEQIGSVVAERDSYRMRAEAADDRKDRSSLQQMHQSLQEQYSVSQLHLAESNRERQQTQALFDAAKDELISLRQTVHESTVVREEAEMRLAILTKDLALCKQTSSRLSDDLSHTSTEASRLRMDCEDLKEAANRERQRVESLKSMLAENQALLDARSVELNGAVHQLAVQRMATAGGGAGIEAQLTEDKRKLQLRVQDLEAEQLSSQQERRALQRLAQSLGVQFQYEKAMRGQLEEQDVAIMLDSISKKDAELAKAREELHQAQNHVSRMDNECRLQEQAYHALREDLEASIAQCRDNASLASQYQSDLTLSQQRYADLRARQDETLLENSDAKSANLGTAQQLSTVRRELQGHVESEMRLQQTVFNLEEERDLLRRQLEEVHQRSKTDRADLQRAIQERQAESDAKETLKTLVSQLEASVRDQANKQHRLAAEVERGGEELHHWEAEKSRLLAAIEEKERRVAEQQVALQRLDQDRDRLQEQVDAMEEDAAQVVSVRRNQEQQFSSLKLVLEQTERKVQTISVELTSAQRHAQAADARLNASQLEVNELKRRFSQKSIEVGGAAEDLMLMTRENQALTSELVEVSAERDRLQQRLQQVLHASASTEHARRSVEVERSDLLSTYRTVLQEKRKLEEDLTQLSTRKQADGLMTHQLRDRVEELQGLVAAQSAAETRWRGERTALVSQLDTLNDQLVRSQHRIESLEADNRRMAQDSSGLKQNNVMLNERINMIIKRAGAATEANKLLTGRLGSVERERDAVRAMVGIERQRAADMSHIAESARVDAATKELHIQRLRAVTTTTSTTVTSNSRSSHSESHATDAAPPQNVNSEFLTGQD